MTEKKKPTDEQIQKEIEALKEIKPKVRHHSAFGTDNRACVEAQIHVLEKRLSYDQIYARYEDVARWEGVASEEILSSAIDAHYWLEGESEEPSLVEGWRGLV